RLYVRAAFGVLHAVAERDGQSLSRIDPIEFDRGLVQGGLDDVSGSWVGTSGDAVPSDVGAANRPRKAGGGERGGDLRGEVDLLSGHHRNSGCPRDIASVSQDFRYRGGDGKDGRRILGAGRIAVGRDEAAAVIASG